MSARPSAQSVFHSPPFTWFAEQLTNRNPRWIFQSAEHEQLHKQLPAFTRFTSRSMWRSEPDSKTIAILYNSMTRRNSMFIYLLGSVSTLYQAKFWLKYVRANDTFSSRVRAMLQ